MLSSVEQLVQVQGRSMEPIFFNGDMIQLSPIEDHPLSPGAIYAYKNPTCWIVHRMIKAEKSSYFFQGDRQAFGEFVSRQTQHLQATRLLFRPKSPPALSILTGLLRFVDQPKFYIIPKNISLHWPWEEMINLAQQHRLLTALSYVLKSSTLWGEVPEFYRKIFQTHLYDAQLRTEKILHLAKKIRTIFPKIHFIKGVKLLPLYPTPIIRPMQDIDLLCDPEDWDKTLERMQENGFSLPDRQSKIIQHHDVPLLHHSSGILIELHHQLDVQGRHKITPALLKGDSDYELLYLCTHAVTHWGRHILNYWEIYRWLKNNPPKLDVLLIKSKKTRSTKALWIALSIIDELWNENYSEQLKKSQPITENIRFQIYKKVFLSRRNAPPYSITSKILQALSLDTFKTMYSVTFNEKRIGIAQEEISFSDAQARWNGEQDSKDLFSCHKSAAQDIQP